MQPANFVTNPSVVAVLPEQQPTFWGILYEAKIKLEYRYVRKKMMTREQFEKCTAST